MVILQFDTFMLLYHSEDNGKSVAYTTWCDQTMDIN